MIKLKFKNDILMAKNNEKKKSKFKCWWDTQVGHRMKILSVSVSK